MIKMGIGGGIAAGSAFALAACSSPYAASADGGAAEPATVAQANPCAAANPCNPCAAANSCNPCNPCAAANPCNKPRRARDHGVRAGVPRDRARRYGIFSGVDKSHNSASIDGRAPEGGPTLQGKLNQDVAVTLDVPGVYGVRCLPHYAMGMVSPIVVGDPDPDLGRLNRIERPGKEERIAMTHGRVSAVLSQHLARRVEIWPYATPPQRSTGHP